MSLSYNVIGLRSAEDPQYKAMLKIKKACDEAGIGYPEPVKEYFKGGGDEGPLKIEIPMSEWDSDYESGFEVKVSDIPQGVEILRFTIG